MSFLAEIDKIRGRSFNLAIWGLLLFFAPGFSFLMFFFPEYVRSLEVFKLVFISASILSPFLILNIFSVFGLFEVTHEKDLFGDLFACTFLSLMFSAGMLYITLLIAFIFTLSFQECVYISLLLQTLLSVVSIFAFKRSRARK